MDMWHIVSIVHPKVAIPTFQYKHWHHNITSLDPFRLVILEVVDHNGPVGRRLVYLSRGVVKTRFLRILISMKTQVRHPDK